MFHLFVFEVLFVISFSSDCLYFRDLSVLESCLDDYCVPRVVWCFWEQEDIPQDILEMIEVSRRSLENFTYCFLSNNNLSNFLDTKSFPEGFHKLGYIPNHADYIRISLLEKYGGIWVDAGTFVNSGKEMEWFVSEVLKNRSQLAGFKYNYLDHEMHFSLLCAPKNSFFMRVFKQKYDVALMNSSEYLSHTCKYLLSKGLLLKKNRCARKWTKAYFMMDLIFTDIRFGNQTLTESVLMLPEERGSLRLFKECQYDYSCIVSRFNHDPTVKEHAFVKLFSYTRYQILEEKKKELGQQGNQTEKVVHKKHKRKHRHL